MSFDDWLIEMYNELNATGFWLVLIQFELWPIAKDNSKLEGQILYFFYFLEILKKGQEGKEERGKIKFLINC